MKAKTICAIICLVAVLFISSCGSKRDEVHKDDTTEKVTAAETTSAIAENENVFDFDNAVPQKAIVMGIGEKRELDGNVIASNGDNISCNNKVITAEKSGVCRVAIDVGDAAVYVVCVLKEGVMRDPSAGAPSLQKVGSTLGFPGGAYNAEYFSSDESVATVDEKGKITFVGEGYVVITSAGVSVPIVTSFVAIDAE